MSLQPSALHPPSLRLLPSDPLTHSCGPATLSAPPTGPRSAHAHVAAGGCVRGKGLFEGREGVVDGIV
jgi:hypothetical protein